MDNSARNQQSMESQPVAPTVKPVPTQAVSQPEPVAVSTQGADSASAASSTLEDKATATSLQQPVIVPNRGGIPIISPSITTAPIQQQVSSSNNREQESAPVPFPDAAKMTASEVLSTEKDIEGEIEALEAKDVVIEESPDTEKPKISPEVKALGVKHAKEDTPMPTEPSGKIILPMTAEEALLTRKKSKWKDSVAWFATLIIFVGKKLAFKTTDKNQ